ncbi:hypothetical protein HJG60_010667 [Phyllostomus discolor]|uniref:Uncharacterized protein n=1 Tax=Phyllostomus discolor TaxID=89673 RepID=A0A834AP96_9CHIR|nr:hypothetical protein HJG60_010667 [Phyllostomus discolor]
MDRTDSDIWLMTVIEINGPTERGMAHGKGKNFPSFGQSHRDLQWRGRQGLITANSHFEQESRILLSEEVPNRTQDVRCRTIATTAGALAMCHSRGFVLPGCSSQGCWVAGKPNVNPMLLLFTIELHRIEPLISYGHKSGNKQ